jgi:hypothetical protein
MVATMEVESHCKAILRANGVKSEATKDYVKVLPALKLDEYEVMLSPYPRLKPVMPFSRWSAAQPTKSLPFYDAYNGVKHDRESESQRATLELAVSSVAACAVLAAAQFGWNDIFGRHRALEEFFAFGRAPHWDYGDLYMLEHEGWPSQEMRYPF